MKRMSAILKHIKKSISKNISFNNYYYKIVDNLDEYTFKIQCKNSKSVFNADITEIVYKLDILFNLSSIQACYIGLKYAKYSVFSGKNIYDKYCLENTCFVANKFEKFFLKCQDRKGMFCYVNLSTHEEYISEPIEMILNDKLISNFNSEQAFYLGYCSGLKIYRKRNSNISYLKNNFEN